jgi:hypothetical protein
VNADRIAVALRRPAVLVSLWIAAVYKFVLAFLTLPPLAHRLDFVCYYDSALALRMGLDPYTSNLSAIGNRFGFETGPLIYGVDTPFFLLLFEPLTRFPPATAFAIWTLFNLVVLGAAIYLLLVRRPGLDASTGWLLGALILAFYPVGWNFFWAQTQVLIMAVLVLAMRAMEDEREGTAGLMVALAGLLRAYPFLLLGYFAVRRKWRALKFAIVGAIAGALIPVAFFGFAQCFSWVHGAAWVSNHDRMIFPFVISIAPFVSRMFWAVFGRAAIDWPRHVAILGADAIILGMTVRVTLAGVGRRDDNFRNYSLWIVTTAMLSPIAWHHYLVLLVIPFVQIVIATVQNRASRRALWMALASYLLACVSVPITFRLLAHPTAFQRAFPSLSAPLLETGFFTLLMGYIAAYWFAVDLKINDQAAAPRDLAEDESDQLNAPAARRIRTA